MSFFRLFVAVLSFLFPLAVSATSMHTLKPHSLREVPERAASSQHLLAQARYLWNQTYDHDNVSTKHSTELSVSETAFICSLRRSLPLGRDGEFYEALAEGLAKIMGRSDSTRIRVALLQHSFCHQPVQMEKTTYWMIIEIHLDEERSVLSQNPVWNACVKNANLSIDLIYNNTDVFVHRQRSTRKKIPWTCRDYHRGATNEWIYRDSGYDLHLALGPRGEFLGILEELPQGVGVRIVR